MSWLQNRFLRKSCTDAYRRPDRIGDWRGDRTGKRHLDKRRLTMPHQVVSRDQWLKARVALLKEEKELTRRSDTLAQQRQELPWVRIDKQYSFETDEGNATL